MKFLKRGLALILSALLAITGLSEMAVESKTDTNANVLYVLIDEDGSATADTNADSYGKYVYKNASDLFSKAEVYYKASGSETASKLSDGNSIRSNGSLSIKYYLNNFYIYDGTSPDFDSNSPLTSGNYVVQSGKTYHLTDIPSGYVIPDSFFGDSGKKEIKLQIDNVPQDDGTKKSVEVGTIILTKGAASDGGTKVEFTVSAGANPSLLYEDGAFSFDLDLSAMLDDTASELDLAKSPLITSPLKVTVSDRKKLYPSVTKSADYSSGGDEITWTILISNPEALIATDPLSIMDLISVDSDKASWYKLDESSFTVKTSTSSDNWDSATSYTKSTSASDATFAVVTDLSGNFRLDLPKASYTSTASGDTGFYTQITYKTKVSYTFPSGSTVASGGTVTNTANLVKTPSDTSTVTGLTVLTKDGTATGDPVKSTADVTPERSVDKIVELGKAGVTSTWDEKGNTGVWYTYNNDGSATLYWKITVTVGTYLDHAEVYDTFAISGTGGMTYTSTVSVEDSKGNTYTKDGDGSYSYKVIENGKASNDKDYVVGWKFGNLNAGDEITICYTTTVTDFTAYSQASTKSAIENEVWATGWLKAGDGPGNSVTTKISAGENTHVTNDFMKKSFESYDSQTHMMKWSIEVNPYKTTVDKKLTIKEYITKADQTWLDSTKRGTNYKITYKIDGGTETDFPSNGDGTSTMKLDETNAFASTEP